MKIYTGYFAKLKSYEGNCLHPFSVALYPPQFFKKAGYQTYHILTPSRELFSKFKNNEISVEKYIEIYCKENLENLDVDSVVKFLSGHSYHNRDVILLCFEKPTFFCHRELIRIWFNQNGVECKEYELHN